MMNNTLKWTLALMTALLMASTMGACSDDPEEQQASCGEGESHYFEGNDYCVYSQDLIIEGFDCPPGFARHDFDDFTVCGGPDSLPPMSEMHFRQRYGEPTSMCSDVSCDTPPVGLSCDGDVAVGFTEMGTCEPTTGMCDYPETRTDCAAEGKICQNGGCVEADLCADVTCDMPPLGLSCEDDVAVGRMQTGTCDPSDGTCTYPETRTDCAAEGKICQNGGCVEAASNLVGRLEYSCAPNDAPVGRLVLTESAFACGQPLAMAGAHLRIDLSLDPDEIMAGQVVHGFAMQGMEGPVFDCMDATTCSPLGDLDLSVTTIDATKATGSYTIKDDQGNLLQSGDFEVDVCDKADRPLCG